MKRILCLFCLMTMLLPACTSPALPPTSTSLPPTIAPEPWKPASAAEVNQLASAFEAMLRIQEAAYLSSDKSAFRSIYTQNAVMKDATYGDYMVGIDKIVGLLNNVVGYFPKWTPKITEGFIGLGGGAGIENAWDFKPDNYQFTRADPQVALDWLQMKNNLISRWTLLYALDSLEKGGNVDKGILDHAKALLSAYQSAWSSGDAQQVAKLYAPSAVRRDSLFRQEWEGNDAVVSFATTLFTKFPGARWDLSMGFGEGTAEYPLSGGLYAISLPGPDGQACKVRTIVILDSRENQITQEEVFYDPQSLIECGWAK